jgi:hypothetical protein
MNPPENSILTVTNGCLFVDGVPFVVDYPEGKLDSISYDNKLVVMFRGHLPNYYPHDQIDGYYA